MERIFSPPVLIAALVFGLAGAVVALTRRGPGRGLRAVETLLLTVAGALLARGFIGLVLAPGDGREAWVTVTGLLFFLWPGAVDLVGAAFGVQPIGPQALLWIACAVGGLTGLFDGLWATHRWTRLGLPEFLLDVTWGLAGSANALLIHLWNLADGRHADEPRHGAHRYRRGFTPGPGFAFTQGSVMSNTGDHGPGSDIFRHEQIHIWQSRLAGPVFWLSYLAWMALAAGPAAVAALVTRRPVARTVEWWTYDQNPWEVMAYTMANPAVREARRARR